MSTFASDISKLLVKAGANMDTFVRYVAVGLAADVVNRSPVDTGRFKGNWQHGAGTINSATDSENDANGEAAIARITAGVDAFVRGETIYVTNSLPYAQRLEYGWSQQAPQGMVRLAVNDFQKRCAEAASKLP